MPGGPRCSFLKIRPADAQDAPINNRLTPKRRASVRWTDISPEVITLGGPESCSTSATRARFERELTAAAEVASGDRADQAGHGTLQRFGSRAGQLVGAVQMASAACVFANFKPVEDLTLNGRAQTLASVAASWRLLLPRRPIKPGTRFVADKDRQS